MSSSPDSEPIGTARAIPAAALAPRSAAQGVRDIHRPAAHPLGPLLSTKRSTTVWITRTKALLVLLAAGSLLGVAAWLEPDPNGIGTHRQLGLAACSLPVMTGYPCPTCGMTTAFAHAVRGQFLSAFMAQPAGLCLALMTGGIVMLAGYTLATGRSWCVNWYRVPAERLAFGAIGVILGGWAFKVIVGWVTGTIPLG